MITKKCKVCGKEFQVKNYRKDLALYCSRSCAGKAMYKQKLSNISRDYMKGNQWNKGRKPVNAFSKGHSPWNKGLKGIHLSPGSEFKKGNKNWNKLPVGTIVSRLERHKMRNFIKIGEPNQWTYLYVYLWEQANGKVPQGYVLHHINGISNDDRLENLICVTRAEHINIHRKELRTAYENRTK